MTKTYIILGIAAIGLASLFYFFPLKPDPDTVWCNNHGGRVFEARGGLFGGGNDVCVFPPEK